MNGRNFRMPDIGEGIVDAEVVAWHVKVGDRVEEDAPLADVMTDKATVEITSPIAGTVASLGCATGERITIGETLVAFGNGAAGSGGAEVTAADETAADETAAGEAANTGRELGELPVDDLTPLHSEPRPDERSGGASPDARSPGRRLNAPRIEDKPRIRVVPESAATPRRRKALASPAVRRRARELGIELVEVLGTGPDGRVLASDLEAGARERVGQQHAASDSDSVARTTAPKPGFEGAMAVDETRPIIGLRRIIARRLTESSRTIPHFTYVDEVDVTELEALRQHLNSRRDASSPRLSSLHFVLLGVCRAVVDWPQCNAHYDDENEVLSTHSAVHLGVATMTAQGLLVPVVHDAQTLDLDEMAAAVFALAEAARARRLPRERLSGSTITVTSLGVLAGIATTPIINKPETAIVAPNRIVSRLAMRDGSVVERKVMNISASFDHRVVDGHDAASFVQALKALLEHPATLFL